MQRQPVRRRSREPLRFLGDIREQYRTPDGCEYLRIALGPPGESPEAPSSPLGLIDAEFLFLPGSSCALGSSSACHADMIFPGNLSCTGFSWLRLNVHGQLVLHVCSCAEAEPCRAVISWWMLAAAAYV